MPSYLAAAYCIPCVRLTWAGLHLSTASLCPQIVYEQPQFVSYFRNATPEPELGFLNIGSRPTRRRQGGGVETLRAIPWIFAWTQTRLVLPAWLGIGEALQALISQAMHRFESLNVLISLRPAQ